MKAELAAVIADACRRQLESVHHDVAVLVDGQKLLRAVELLADGRALAVRGVVVVGARRVVFGAEYDLEKACLV